MSEYMPKTEQPKPSGFWVSSMGDRAGPFWVDEVTVAGFGYLAFYRVSPEFEIDPAPFALRRPSVTDLHLLDEPMAKFLHDEQLRSGPQWAGWRGSRGRD